MVDFKPIKLPESQIKTYPIKEGQLLFATDTYGIYLDISGSERKSIEQVITITEENRSDMLLPLIGFYYTTDEHKLYYYDSDWHLINENVTIKKSSKNGYLSVNGQDILIYNPSDLSVSYGPSELSALVSGELLSLSLGKVKVAVDSLISHLSNFTNPHKVSKSQIGLSKVDNLSSDDILNLITYEHIVNALGYTPPTQDTTYKAATATTMGLVKSGNHISVGSDGTVTVIGGYATQLAKNISFTLTGAITGTVSFNGSKNVSVETTLSSVPASKISGVLSIDNLPQGALERLVKVANKAARLKLTASQVQLGDSVQELDTGIMYIVVDESKLNSEEGYSVYTAGSAASVPWSGVTGKPSTFTPSTHTHTKSQITDFPTSMPASDVHPWAKAATKPTYTPTEVGVISTAPTSGQVAVFDGTAGKIKSTGFTIGASVPSGAKFTDTTYGLATASANGLIKIGYSANGKNYPVVLDSEGKAYVSVPWTDTNTTYTLGSFGITATAAELNHTKGVTSNIQTQLNSKASSGHTHNYAGSSSAEGPANSAVKLATPRNINGVAFDGTTNINVLANPITTTLTNQNLNDIKTPGLYNAGGSNTVTNKPSGFDAFGLIVIKSAEGYVTQFCVGGNNSPNKVSVRKFDTQSWGNWEYLYSTAYKPTKADVGLSSVDNTADSAKSVKYAASAGTANALGTNAGTTTQPVYFSGGKPVVCGFTVETSVPKGAKFTDTIYTLPTATDSVLGGVKTGANITNSSGTISITKANVVAALGYTPPTANTTYGAGNATTLGLTKLYTATGAATDGTMTQKAITDALGGKAASSHTHPATQITGLPTSLKNPYGLTIKTNGTTAATYDGSSAKEVNITPANIGAATSSHTHTKSQITDFPSAIKNPYALTINGTVYDGSSAKTVNISTTWGSISGKPDLLNCMRMYGGTALDSKGTTADTAAQYNTIVLSTTTVNTVGFNKVLTDLPKGKYSVMIRLKISANSSSGNILKMECGDTSALKTFYIKPNMFSAANKYQTFGFTVDLTTTSFTTKLSVGTALSGVTANIDYIAIAPAFTAITSIA